MIIGRGKLAEYLSQIGFYSDLNIEKFDNYYTELVAMNQKINLFSRKMQLEEIWTRHFIDSLRIFEIYQEWSGKKVLDFGTGGGLPGLPIKILAVDSEVTFLDSTRKKVEALREMAEKMQLMGVFFKSDRIEALQRTKFDIIVSRAVKITPKIASSLLKLLNKEGKIFLYKSEKLDDIACFKDYTLHKLESYDYSPQQVGIATERNIVEIKNG